MACLAAWPVSAAGDRADELDSVTLGEHDCRHGRSDNGLTIALGDDPPSTEAKRCQQVAQGSALIEHLWSAVHDDLHGPQATTPGPVASVSCRSCSPGPVLLWCCCLVYSSTDEAAALAAAFLALL